LGEKIRSSKWDEEDLELTTSAFSVHRILSKRWHASRRKSVVMERGIEEERAKPGDERRHQERLQRIAMKVNES